jgi:uncharacterized membrane protein affecting hemolysin expression
MVTTSAWTFIWSETVMSVLVVLVAPLLAVVICLLWGKVEVVVGRRRARQEFYAQLDQLSRKMNRQLDFVQGELFDPLEHQISTWFADSDLQFGKGMSRD